MEDDNFKKSVKSMNEFKIGNRVVGPSHPPLVIAEIGINHNGSLDLAITMADAAIEAGAEVIKHQTHIVEDEMSVEARNIIPGNAEQSIYSIMEACALDEADEYKLMQYIESRNCTFISTAFSRAAVERLGKFNVPAVKIGSGECNNYPLVEEVAKLGKPIILSTGMNSISSIRPAVDIIRKRNIPFALLHCTNIYPTPPHLVRLGGMTEMQEAFPDAIIGLSDHTVSNYTCLGAVALGACILERHFTDKMERDGPDIVCSMDPSALSELIEGSETIFYARGGSKGPVEEENPTIAFAFASVVAQRDINHGEALNSENIWLKRPGGGDFSVNDYQNLLGKKVKKSVKGGTQLTKSDVDF